MRWLITVRKNVDLDRLKQRLRAHGVTCDPDPVPLGDAESVIRASGPDDLPEALETDPEVIEVYPDSEPEPY